MTFTVVFFHAHPDDEALYTGGTMARLASEGHRVVLVTATRGEAGLTSAGTAEGKVLGSVREEELERAAALLGCSRLVMLGLPDSGSGGDSEDGFANRDPGDAAARLAEILDAEAAHALVTYDANGGYGHPDHVQVHRVGKIAARMAGVRLELHATVDRNLLRIAERVASLAGLASSSSISSPWERVYSARREITHRVDVREYLPQKRAAMEAHRSQAVGGETRRTLSFLLGLPSPLFRLAMGREWFIESGRRPARRTLDDLLYSLR